jgi:hypothetical protein
MEKTLEYILVLRQEGKIDIFDVPGKSHLSSSLCVNTSVWAYNNYIVCSAIISTSSETKKDSKGKDPMSPEKITLYEPTAVKRTLKILRKVSQSQKRNQKKDLEEVA